MVKRLINRPLVIVTLFLVAIALVSLPMLSTQLPSMTSAPKLLTQPFLQLPTQTSVRVVWFTEFPGSRHTVTYGKGLIRTVAATTTKLTRTREDEKSKVGTQQQEGQVYQQITTRDIWRHEAVVTGLTPGDRIPYRVTSIGDDGQAVNSDKYTLTSQPLPQTPLKILLTSDHQLMPMTSANLQKVAETMGRIDAIFHAGDLVNIPDRASEWFDDNRGGAFFACLQGRANYELDKHGIKTIYKGGELIQHAPLFPTVGNHEVMGRFSTDAPLNAQFDDPVPRAAAAEIYQKQANQINPKNDPTIRDAWIKDNSFNTDAYNEIFSLPETGKNYYAVSFGDIRLVVLYVTNIWRTPRVDADAKGRYREREQDLNNPEKWGYGQHIFEPIVKGSEQYRWLEQELGGSEFKQAKYKIVMFHHPPHSLGDNVVPPYTDPVQQIERDLQGKITAVRYQYPKEANYIIRDVVPLLEDAGVQLVLYGHTHVWNRFVSDRGTNFLETSNVGNTYGAYLGDNKRKIPTGYESQSAATDDPNGLEPVIPTLAPLLGEDNQPLPYVASNDITVFSILDTGTGTVSSYRFDTRLPNSDVVKFDEFSLLTSRTLSQKMLGKSVTLVSSF